MAAGGGVLTPSLELGVRHDGGDAETGYGADIGAGLSWSDPARGLSAEVRARGLLAHEAAGFRERGFSGTLSWDPEPASTLGPSLTLSQALGGASSGGAEALLGRRHLDGLTQTGGVDDLERRSLEARLGYGFSLSGGYTGTPELGLGLTHAHREMSLGWRLEGARNGAFELRFEGARLDAANDDAEHRIGMTLKTRW